MLKLKTSVEFDYSVDSLAFSADGGMIAGSGLAASGLTVFDTTVGTVIAFVKYDQALQLDNAIAWSSTGEVGYPHAAGTELRLAKIGPSGISIENTVSIIPFIKSDSVSFSPNGEFAALPGTIPNKIAHKLFLDKSPVPDILVVRIASGETFPIATGYLSKRLIWLSNEEIASVGGVHKGRGRVLSCFNFRTKETKSIQLSNVSFDSTQIAVDRDRRAIYVSGWIEDSDSGLGNGKSTLWCLSEDHEGNWQLHTSLQIPWNVGGDAKCSALQYSPALKRLVALVYDEAREPLRLIDPETGDFEGVEIGLDRTSRALAVSRDGGQIAISVGERVRIFEVAK